MSSKNIETRTRILKAALELLEASAGKDVRMSDIAKQAGVSRQALYLHFTARADLLIEATVYLDSIKGSDARLSLSRAAKTGIERLDAFVDAWGNYIPEIYSVGKVLMAIQDTDEAAKHAWGKRMQDVREGCQAAILALDADDMLDPAYSPEQATDILWSLLSVRTWEQFRQECHWPQEEYIKTLKSLTRRIFVKTGG